LALSLAAVGLYGVLAFSVARRTGEIGVRIALGARQSQVLREILYEAGRMVALGLVTGLPIAWMASKLVSVMLFGVTAHVPVTSVTAIEVTLVTGSCAVTPKSITDTSFAWMASKLVSVMLFGVTAHDPVTSVTSIAVLVGAAFVAAFLPARRAARVDPLVAIRYE